MKKAHQILRVVLLFLVLVTFLLIPFNILVHAFPVWIVWADIVLLAVCTVSCLFLIKKNVWKAIVGIICTLSASTLLFFTCCCPYWNSVTWSGGYMSIITNQMKPTSQHDSKISLSDAKRDIDRTIKTLKHIHPAFLDGTPENISSAYDESIQRLEQDDFITVTDVRREISRILALLHDGHTNLSCTGNSELYLKNAYIRFKEGWKPNKINGVSADALYAESLPLFSCEAESDAKNTFYNQLITASGLALLGCDPFDLTVTWSRDGDYETETYSKDDYIADSELTALGEAYSGHAEEEFVYYSIDQKNDLAVLTLRQCIYNDEYNKCVHDFFSEVKACGIGNVAVDLRSNRGGNSGVTNEFIRYLPVDRFQTSTYQWRWGAFLFDGGDGVSQNPQYEDLLFDGKLYVLTNTATFSSAMVFSQYITDNGLGTIIGESPSNAANSYGEITLFQLDKTGLIISVSTKAFLRAGQSKSDFVIPDIECPSDQAMDVLLECITH